MLVSCSCFNASCINMRNPLEKVPPHKPDTPGWLIETTCSFLLQSHPGTNVTVINLFDRSSSLQPMWKQVEGFKEAIYPIMQNAEDGVHFICYSQGLRAFVKRDINLVFALVYKTRLVCHSWNNWPQFFYLIQWGFNRFPVGFIHWIDISALFRSCRFPACSY